MKRTIGLTKNVAVPGVLFERVLFVFACLIAVPNVSIGQHAMPALYPVNVLQFSIPFEVGESAISFREIEILVSKDRGRRWHTAGRQSIESEKFPYQAAADGEYWFAFRRVPMHGNLPPFNGQPQLRVLVDTTGELESIFVQPMKSSESGQTKTGPITPPKPERFQPNRTKTPNTKTPDNAPTAETSTPATSTPAELISSDSSDSSENQDTQKSNVALSGDTPVGNPLDKQLGNPLGMPLGMPLLVAIRPHSAEGDAEGEESGDAGAGREFGLGQESGLGQELGADVPRQPFGPRLPGFEPPDPTKASEGDFLSNLLNDMRPFMDIQPVLTGPTLPRPHSASQASSPELSALTASSRSLSVGQPVSGQPVSSGETTVGGITGISLNQPNSQDSEPRFRIVVQWNPGQERWEDAQIDILRSSTLAGPWIPIAVNLPNSGEYWWFLTPEDLRPFHVAVRIRSLSAGIREDVTQSAITIDPSQVDTKLAQFQRF